MSRRHVATLTTAVVALALALSACGRPWMDGARARRGAGSEQTVLSGQAVFERRCAACHTTTRAARIGPGLGGLFQRERLPNGQPVTEAEVRSWIVQGGGWMPPQRLTPAELEALLPYLKALE